MMTMTTAKTKNAPKIIKTGSTGAQCAKNVRLTSVMVLGCILWRTPYNTMILWWTNGGGLTSAEKCDIWLLKLVKSFAL